ncbi:MAG: sigma-70 family RNA polymerase sigma factor [Phycisphaerales bacterium]|nr:MAG: sigma-70 family RNA polymerase sigma factor [Phycisphaerales bacterium]
MLRSDEDLMLSYRAGDDDAFEILYRRYEKPLLNFLYRVVKNVAEAENLCQETFFRMVRAKKKYVATAQFKTWLYHIAYNLCRDRLRRKTHRSTQSLNALTLSRDEGGVELQERIADPSSDPDRDVEKDELIASVKNAIAHLPETEHLVVILREYQGLEVSEIADILNCPVGTVKSHNHRARKKLKIMLAKYIGD